MNGVYGAENGYSIYFFEYCNQVLCNFKKASIFHIPLYFTSCDNAKQIRRIIWLHTFRFCFFRILFLIKLADHEGWTSVYAAMSVLSKTLGPLAFLILPKFEQNERVSQRQRGILVGDRQRIDSKNLSRNLRFVKDYNLRTVQSQQGYWQICILYIKKYEIFVFRTV